MDPISDLLIRIKNAGMVGKPLVVSYFSKIKYEIASLLSRNGFVGEVRKKIKDNEKFLEVDLLQNNGKPRINNIKIISKPSRRIYSKSKEINSYMQGYGMAVLSTPSGILSDFEARKRNIGGELLFKIW